MTTLAHYQPQIAFVTVSSRGGIGMIKPVSLPVAEIIVYFLSTVWLITLALMIRELVIVGQRTFFALDFIDAWLWINIIPQRSDFELCWLALRSDWTWLWPL